MSAEFHALVEATWPPAATRRLGPWTLRDGAGGGKRVAAATAEAEVGAADLAALASAIHGAGETPLVMVREGEMALDALLAARGYALIDPVVGYTAPVEILEAAEPHRHDGFTTWPPLQVQREIWAEGGIDAARVAVMGRVAGAKAAVLGRDGDQPAGTAFVALHGDAAMVHAIEVRTDLRRRGTGKAMLCCAAHWAAGRGARTVSVIVTEANTGARALYSRLGMVQAGRYHYRIAAGDAR